MSEKLGDDRIRHLEMLQAVISRMASASATMKNLCLIIVAGALAFIATSEKPNLALFAAVLTAVFWFLDARYLQQEKWFRDMYDTQRALNPTEAASFGMTPSSSIRSVSRLSYGLKSWSTCGLYGPLILFLIVVWLFAPGGNPVASGGCPNG